MSTKKSFNQRLADGETILCAEGYLFEIERRGYMKAGPFVPEVVLEHPEVLEQLHREWVHAGSDVVQAFTYYGHREKWRLIGRENDLELMNRKAMELATKVANETGALAAGNICNTTRYDPKNKKTHSEVMEMFKECVTWAVEGGADFIVGETFLDYGEAKIALDAIKQYGHGLPSVITLAQPGLEKLRDGYTYAEACKLLEDQGATVVGLNCFSGPKIMVEMMKEVKKTCKGPLAALPVPYRTTQEQHTMLSLTLPETNERAFFANLDHYLVAQDEIEVFGKACVEMGIQYAGICCGNSSRYFRKLAETMGRTPPASRYTTDMSSHFVYGDKKKTPLLHDCNVDTLRKIIVDS